MKQAKWIDNSALKLSSTSETPRLDAEILLGFVLNKDRAWIHAYPEYILQRSDLDTLGSLVDRRSSHEPVAYIIGRQEFYGRQFCVNADVLVPRPESESIIELLLNRLTSTHVVGSPSYTLNPISSNLIIVDVGTGSGALAITTALELSHLSPPAGGYNPQPLIYAIDIDKKCLSVARKNAKQLKAEVTFLHGNLLTPVLPHLPFTIPQPLYILANLPYVPNHYPINKAAEHEPTLALYGGFDGLDLYRELFEQLSKVSGQYAPIYIYTESLESQHEHLIVLAKSSGYELLQTAGLAQEFRKIL